MYLIRKTNSLIASFRKNGSYCYTQSHITRITLKKSHPINKVSEAVHLHVPLADVLQARSC